MNEKVSPGWVLLAAIGVIVLFYFAATFRDSEKPTPPAVSTALQSATPDRSAARERLENKIHAQALIMLGLEDTTVITSQDRLMVKIPRLTQRDVLLDSETYRPILRAWMNALKSDFAAAAVTNVCVYESAWSGRQLCANPEGDAK